VSELLRLCAELCNEFKLFASLSINLLAASNFAKRVISDVGRLSFFTAVAATGIIGVADVVDVIDIAESMLCVLLLSDSDVVSVISA
jgi:hypothetical protein